MSRRTLVALGALAVVALAAVGIAQLTGGGGEAHSLGTEVVVGHHAVADDGSEGARTQIGLTVLRVREGTQDDLEANGIEVDPEDRTATPYYVDARYSNKGSEAVPRALSVGLEDSDGATYGRLTIFGIGGEPFEPCPETEPEPLGPGESYEACTLVLIPDGVEVERVYFLSDRGPDREPEWVYWKTE